MGDRAVVAAIIRPNVIWAWNASIMNVSGPGSMMAVAAVVPAATPALPEPVLRGQLSGPVLIHPAPAGTKPSAPQAGHFPVLRTTGDKLLPNAA